MIKYIIMQLFVLFIYVLWRKEYRKDKKLEVYDIPDEISKQRLEDIIKEGHIMKINIGNNDVLNNFKNDEEKGVYSMFDMNVIENNNDDNNDVNLTLIQQEVNELLERSPNYISMNNMKYLEETGQLDYLVSMESIIKPYMKMDSKYDYIVGSTNSYSPLRLQNKNRLIIHLLSGSLDIKIIPDKYSDKFSLYRDVFTGEIQSNINVWDNMPNGQKSMIINLEEGETLLMPRNWLYSIKAKSHIKVIEFKYDTFIGYVGSIWNKFEGYLQRQNTRLMKY